MKRLAIVTQQLTLAQVHYNLSLGIVGKLDHSSKSRSGAIICIPCTLLSFAAKKLCACKNSALVLLAWDTPQVALDMTKAEAREDTQQCRLMTWANNVSAA